MKRFIGAVFLFLVLFVTGDVYAGCGTMTVDCSAYCEGREMVRWKGEMNECESSRGECSVYYCNSAYFAAFCDNLFDGILKDKCVPTTAFYVWKGVRHDEHLFRPYKEVLY